MDAITNPTTEIKDTMKTPEEEIWKDIEGYEGYYQVSNRGRVRSLDRENTKPSNGQVCSIKGRVRRLMRTPRGYDYMFLSKGGKKKGIFVHRLVAHAFCDGYADGLVVNHIDCVTHNNIPSNLEWVTRGENNKHSFRTGRRNHRGEKGGRSKLQNADALEIRKLYNEGMKQADIARKYGINPTSIWKIVTGRTYNSGTSNPIQK